MLQSPSPQSGLLRANLLRSGGGVTPRKSFEIRGLLQSSHTSRFNCQHDCLDCRSRGPALAIELSPECVNGHAVPVAWDGFCLMTAPLGLQPRTGFAAFPTK